jgi:hypothetical protein
MDENWREAGGAAALELIEMADMQLDAEESSPEMRNAARSIASVSQSLGIAQEEMTPAQMQFATAFGSRSMSQRRGFFSIPHLHRVPNVR